MNFKNTASALLLTATGIVNLITALPASAKPVDGVFSIQSRNGNFVDVYGDNFRNPGDNTRVATHLWNLKDKSNNFELGPDEGSGNEIRVAGNPGGQPICLTPNAPLGSRPADGTAVVATRDCNNSWNWKRVGQQWVIGRHMDLCLDIVWGKDQVWNGMQVVTCGNNNPAQQFGTGQTQPKVDPPVVYNPPVVTQPYVAPVQQTQQQDRITSTSNEEVNVKYQAVLISARAGTIDGQTPKVGHTIFAAVKSYEIYKVDRYISGKVVRTPMLSTMEKTTLSSPGYQLKLDLNSARVNNGGIDNALFKIWADAGNSPRENGVSFRTTTINAEQYRQATPKSIGGYNNSYRGLGCFTYDVFTQAGCNCTTVSAKLFQKVTGENFTSINPTQLAQAIDKRNQLGDWFDGGNKHNWLPIRF
jgi:hypothetical protein